MITVRRQEKVHPNAPDSKEYYHTYTEILDESEIKPWDKDIDADAWCEYVLQDDWHEKLIPGQNEYDLTPLDLDAEQVNQDFGFEKERREERFAKLVNELLHADADLAGSKDRLATLRKLYASRCHMTAAYMAAIKTCLNKGVWAYMYLTKEQKQALDHHYNVRGIFKPSSKALNHR